MSIKTIECVECGETVPHGRLACPSCGALLAAVAGAPPPAVKIIETPAAVPDAPAAPVAAMDVPAHVAAATTSAAPAAAPEPVASATAAPASVLKSAVTPARSKPKAPQPPAAAAPSNGHEPEATPTPAKPKAPQPPTPIEAVIPAVAPVPTPPATTTEAPAQVAYLLEPATDAPPPSTWLTAAPPAVETGTAEPDSPWPPLLEAEGGLVARPYGWSGSPGVAGTAVPPPVPGAYLPPSGSGASAMAMTGGPLAGAMAAAAPASDPTAAARLRIADAFAGIDRPRLVEISGWFVLVGSAMAVLGFFLPWSMVVIGAGGTGGYLDDWGLASPTHLLVLVGLLAVLGLGVIESPVPPWLRTGVLGLTFGGLLIGLIWPYAIGPLRADIGATVTVLGAVSLLIGGLVASWASRHSETPPPV
jgi:hypothetical protein